MSDGKNETAALTRDITITDEATRGMKSLPDLENEYSVMIVFAENENALQFPLRDSKVIGRRSEVGSQPDIDLAPFGGFPAGVSRRHLLLRRSERGLIVEDLGSSNGTWVQGRRIAASSSIELRNGDAIRLGHLQSWVYFSNLNK